jgi:signal peptidase I
MRKFLASSLELIEVAAVALATVIFIRSFLFQPFLVSGQSMVPNFANGDYLLIDEFTYRFREPQRGEVIVFRPPVNESVYYIKRVIGLPGETVRVQNGHITVMESRNSNAIVLDEHYLPDSTVTMPMASNNVEFVLGKDQYFVLGDNRAQSYDSRSWGLLEKKAIIGIARVRLWPLVDAQAFAAPQY